MPGGADEHASYVPGVRTLGGGHAKLGLGPLFNGLQPLLAIVGIDVFVAEAARLPYAEKSHTLDCFYSSARLSGDGSSAFTASAG